MEDVCLLAERDSNLCSLRMETFQLLPRAWSDKLFFFTESLGEMGNLMRSFFDILWKVYGLRIKTGSVQLVRAGRQGEPDEHLTCGGHSACLMSCMKCLGYDIQGNGSTSVAASKMVGLLRSKIALGYAFLHASGVEAWSRARWMKMHLRGIIRFCWTIFEPKYESFCAH